MADLESSDNVGSQNGNLKSKTLITRSGDERPNNVTESEKSVELPKFKVPELLHPDQLKQPRQNETFETASASETENKVEEDKEQITSKFDNLSPAEKLKESQIPIPYKEPSWGGLSKDKFSFEVLKNGVIIDTIDLTKSFYIIGRLPSCDITLEHPSLSRHHAVIQYCTTKTEKHNIGWYLYDLDSTHGTWINKNKVYAKKYYGIHVGHVLKFGGSTRLFILQVIIDFYKPFWWCKAEFLTEKKMTAGQYNRSYEKCTLHVYQFLLDLLVFSWTSNLKSEIGRLCFILIS